MQARRSMPSRQTHVLELAGVAGLAVGALVIAAVGNLQILHVHSTLLYCGTMRGMDSIWIYIQLAATWL